MDNKGWMVIAGIILLFIIGSGVGQKKTTTSAETCKQCGSGGILDFCDRTECLGLGNCAFISHVGGLSVQGDCVSKDDPQGYCNVPKSEKCTLPTMDVPIEDNSGQNPYCVTGWCSDESKLRIIPLGDTGICDDAPFGKTPHEVCSSKIGFCIKFFNDYLGTYTDQNCQTSTIAGILGILIILMIIMRF